MGLGAYPKASNQWKKLGSKPWKSDLVYAFNSKGLFYMGQRNGEEASDRC